jgi:hypothetical protein
MSSYNLTSSANYVIYTDLTGVLYDSGGPDLPYLPDENYYVLISPEYTTGPLTLNLKSFNAGTGDSLRIYDRIPNSTEFLYDGTTVSGELIGYFEGTLVSPVQITSSTGKAYLRFFSDSVDRLDGFELEWTGSSYTPPDSVSGTPFNKYAVTLPSNINYGSYITFDKGVFTGSISLSANKDFLIGFWAKSDTGMYGSVDYKGILSIGNLNAGQCLILAKPSNSRTLATYYVDSNNKSMNMLSPGVLMGGFGNPLTDVKAVPQWHHYGIALKKTSETSTEYRVYRDGAIYSSASYTVGSPYGDITTSRDIVLGSYRDGALGTIQAQYGCWSGSFDDVFLGTTVTGSTTDSIDSFFSSIYNSGSWSNPVTVASETLDPTLTPTILFNWRFEETGSVLSTIDNGSLGNIHSASFVSSDGGVVSLTPVVSGISYTPYSSLSYPATSYLFLSSAESFEEYEKNYVIGLYKNLSLTYNRNTQQVPFSLNKKGTGKLRNP